MNSQARALQAATAVENPPALRDAQESPASKPSPRDASLSGCGSVANASLTDAGADESNAGAALQRCLLAGEQRRSAMLEELVELVGDDGAAALIEQFGGTRLYVPYTPKKKDTLTMSIGMAAAVKLARIFGGDRVDIPNPTARRLLIRQLHASGQSVDAIARQLRCTRRRVFQVLAEGRSREDRR